MHEDEKVIVLCQAGLPIRAYSIKSTSPEAIDEARKAIYDERKNTLRHAFCTLHPAREIESVLPNDIPEVTTEVVTFTRY